MRTMQIDEVLALYEKRDQSAKAEMALEDIIFSKVKRSAQEAQALGNQYRKLKDRRAEASIKAAVAYMQLSPEDKATVDQAWKKTSEGKRKAATTGIRGKGGKK